MGNFKSSFTGKNQSARADREGSTADYPVALVGEPLPFRAVTIHDNAEESLRPDCDLLAVLTPDYFEDLADILQAGRFSPDPRICEKVEAFIPHWEAVRVAVVAARKERGL